VAAFLPPRQARQRLDVDKPAAFGGLLGPDVYQEVREGLHRALMEIETLAPQYYAEWERLTGRSYDVVEGMNLEGAEVVLVTSGTVSETAREVIDSDFGRKHRVGLLQVRLFRPFPTARLRALLAGIPKVAVIDRNCSFGHHGVFFQELKSALYGLPDDRRPTAYGYVAGLGGRDINVETLQDAVRRTLERPAPEPETEWLGAVLPSRPAAAPACGCAGAGAAACGDVTEVVR
jgi:pyruvate/2-oxoacid:ferredoxin oxidoreductase alpha subunit